MIREGSHGFVKLLPLHGLNGRHDLGAAKPKRGGGSGGNNRYPHPLCGSLKSVEVVSRLPLFRHAAIYTFKVYCQADNLKISTFWLARLCPSSFLSKFFVRSCKSRSSSRRLTPKTRSARKASRDRNAMRSLAASSPPSGACVSQRLDA